MPTVFPNHLGKHPATQAQLMRSTVHFTLSLSRGGADGCWCLTAQEHLVQI